MNFYSMLGEDTRPNRYDALAAIRLEANAVQKGASPEALEALVATMPALARIEMENLISSAAGFDCSGDHEYASSNRASAKIILGVLGRTTCRAALADMLTEIES